MYQLNIQRKVYFKNYFSSAAVNNNYSIDPFETFKANSTCGNGNSGQGVPGVERQVNAPEADATSFPRITQSETSLAYFNNFILYGFNDSNDAGSFSGFAFSSDGGVTWCDCGSLPRNPDGLNGGDPSLAVDKNGVFYYGQIGKELINNELESVISVSTGTINPDRTITMNVPQIVGRGRGIQDKEWIAVGPDKNNPGYEALYVVWTDLANFNIRFAKFRTGENLTELIASKDIVVSDGIEFGAFPVIDSAGNIYVFYEHGDPGAFTQLGTPNRIIRMVKSTDGGNSFQPSVPVSSTFSGAATDVVSCDIDRSVIKVVDQRVIRMFELPQAAIGPDGTIYVVWNAGRVVGGTTFIDIFLACSKDEGNTWNQVTVTNTPSHAFFPSVAVNNMGAHIQYNRFNDPDGVGGVGNGTFGIFIKTFSFNTGLYEEKMVSTEFSPVPNNRPNFDPGVVSCYMADYNQIIAGPDNSLLHAWGDNRNILNNENNPDVFFKQTV